MCVSQVSLSVHRRAPCTGPWTQSPSLYRALAQPHCACPPTNEVWAKVMFLHLSVILSTGGGHLVSAPLHAGIHTPLGRHPLGRHPLGRHPLGRHPLGRHPPGRHPLGRHPRQTPPPPSTTGYGQQAGGTHPIGLHSCFLCIISFCSLI